MIVNCIDLNKGSIFVKDTPAISAFLPSLVTLANLVESLVR